MSDKDTHGIEMNEKISKLIDYIKNEFPDGCGHPNSEFDCHAECPLYNCKVKTLEHDVCEMLSIAHYLRKKRNVKNTDDD